MSRRGSKLREFQDLTPDVATDDIAKQYPALALKPHQLQLADGSKIGRASIDLNPWQKPFELQVLRMLFSQVTFCCGMTP